MAERKELMRSFFNAPTNIQQMNNTMCRAIRVIMHNAADGRLQK